MNKKTKLLKNWIRTRSYFTAIVVFASLSGPLLAVHIYDGNDDNDGNPRRLIRIVFGITHYGVPDSPAYHPNVERKVHEFNAKEKNIGAYMRDLQPPINAVTHIEFWKNPSVDKHTKQVFLAELGAQANAYINAAPAGVLTFSSHTQK